MGIYGFLVRCVNPFIVLTPIKTTCTAKDISIRQFLQIGDEQRRNGNECFPLIIENLFLTRAILLRVIYKCMMIHVYRAY